MLIISDFDGTVTARDTNSALASHFAPEVYEGLEGKLGRRELTLREVLGAEFAGVTAGLDAVLEIAFGVPFRAGFGDLVAAAEDAGASFVLLSSGFREVIEPMLAREGFARQLPIIANSIRLDDSGGTITWRDLPECGLCGEPCKRHDVAQLREQHAGSGEQVVFIGDGFSDRCGAETADIVFARDSLASYMDERGYPYRPWDDFTDVARELGLVDDEVRA